MYFNSFSYFILPTFFRNTKAEFNATESEIFHITNSFLFVTRLAVNTTVRKTFGLEILST